jgi:hypothetical protein
LALLIQRQSTTQPTIHAIHWRFPATKTLRKIIIFRVLFAALAAGLLVGVVLTQIQALITTPVVIEAEAYET